MGIDGPSIGQCLSDWVTEGQTLWPGGSAAATAGVQAGAITARVNLTAADGTALNAAPTVTVLITQVMTTAVSDYLCVGGLTWRAGAGAGTGVLQILMDGTTIAGANKLFYTDAAWVNNGAIVTGIQLNLSAGSHTFKLQVTAPTNSNAWLANDIVLSLVELKR